MALGIGFKIVVTLAAVLVTGAIVSVAKAGKAPGTPEPKPDDQVPDQIKGFLDKWLSDTTPEQPAEPPPTHVRWFLYRGKWISVAQFDEPEPEIDDEMALSMGPLGREYSYRARFRWVVFNDGSEYAAPLALGETTTTGTAKVPGPGDEGVEMARQAAAQVATEQATAWIDAFLKGK